MQATEDDDGPALHYLAAECANAFNEIMRISRSQKPVVQTEVVGKNFRETRERYEQWSNNYGAAKLPQDEAALTNLIEDLFLIKDTLCRILRDLRETLDLGKSVYGQIWVKQVIIALLVTKIISVKTRSWHVPMTTLLIWRSNSRLFLANQGSQNSVPYIQIVPKAPCLSSTSFCVPRRTVSMASSRPQS
jgi:hypothetical protein